MYSPASNLDLETTAIGSIGELNAPTTSQQTETAAFSGEAFAPSEVMRVMPQFTSSDSALTSDVRKILARPKFHSRVEMVTPIRQEIGLNHLFYESTFDIDNRFAGNLGFRATTCFRVVVAASPQVGGRLRAFYNPNRVYRNISNTNRNDSWRSGNITGYTQLPGVELDLETATAIDFKIPYTSFLEYMPLRGPNGETNPRVSLGSFSIVDYLPIQSDYTAQAIPYYTLYTWLEDIEVFGARNPLLYRYNFSSLPNEYEPIAYVVEEGANYKVKSGSLVANSKTFQSEFEFVLESVIPGEKEDVTIKGISSSPGGDPVGTLYATTFTASAGYTPCTGTQDGADFTLTISFADADGVNKGLVSFANRPFLVAELQSGIEEDTVKDGPLSGPLYKLSKAASLVGDAIPSISSVTTPLSWFTRSASNAAAAFGFSRPVQLEPNHRFWSSANHYQNNADGPDTSFNLGLLQDNKVALSGTVGGTDVDEMALSYLTQKSVAITRFSIATQDVGMRYTLSLSPFSMYFGADGEVKPIVQPPFNYLDVSTGDTFDPSNDLPEFHAGSVITPTPLFMLGTMFKLYRGGFKITLKCNKTRFHGGRLMVAYTPFTETVPDTKNVWAPEQIEDSVLNEADLYGHTVVWDLRESSECVIECPYIFNTPYLKCEEPFGSLCVSVIDNINAPANVSQDLVFAVEVAGLSGFEFARPEQKDFIVNFGDDYRSGDRFSYGPEVELQSGVCPFPVDMADKSCDAIGEKILSTKQLISRTEWVTPEAYIDDPLNDNVGNGYALRTWFEPYCGVGTYVDVVPNVGSNYHYAGSYIKSTRDIVTSSYMFCRGSTCYDIISDSSFGFSLSNDELPDNGLWGKGSNVFESGPYGHVKLPFYSKTTKVPTNPMLYAVNAVDLSKPNIDSPINIEFARALLDSGDSTRTYVGVRAADDAQLGFFIGAPRLMYAPGGGWAPKLFTGETFGGVIYGATDKVNFGSGSN